mgnify:CR=1 FL=1
MKFLHSKESRRELINSIIAIIIGFVFLFPIYWLLQISFKSDAETFGRVLTSPTSSPLTRGWPTSRTGNL